MVNGKVLDKKSYQVKDGDEISLKDESQNIPMIIQTLSSNERDVYTYSQSRIDYTNNLTKGIVSDQRRAQITEDSALAVNILESASKLGPDSTEFERNSIASQIGFIKSPLIKAQFKNLDVDFRKSLNNLMPVFESGDFANAPESFNEDLTKI